MKETKKDSVKARLSDILLLVSWGDISIEYFGKSGVWLYHMLDGVDDNKQPAEFSVEEIKQLKGALVDLANRIRRAADNLDKPLSVDN